MNGKTFLNFNCYISKVGIAHHTKEVVRIAIVVSDITRLITVRWVWYNLSITKISKFKVNLLLFNANHYYPILAWWSGIYYDPPQKFYLGVGTIWCGYGVKSKSKFIVDWLCLVWFSLIVGIEVKLNHSVLVLFSF